MSTSSIRFRADYRRTVQTDADGAETHAIGYPRPFGRLGVLSGNEPVGHVLARPGEPVYAFAADAAFLGDHADVDKAVIAVIEHDQAKHNALKEEHHG